MEALIDTAETPQLLCMAGFFTLLAYGTARASDAQGSRGLRLTADAIAAESLTKNKHVWTKWFCSGVGVQGDWATKWMEALACEGLPGQDYILLAPNASFDAWLDRPAEYSDIRRALHFIYHVYCGMGLDKAAAYNPHGFRHFMVEAGQQLRSLNICSSAGVERLGHWAKGSAMPQTYDSTSGVSELQDRHIVLKSLRSGWRPAQEGELPKAPIHCGRPEKREHPEAVAELLVDVGHLKRKTRLKKRHADFDTISRKWACGTECRPSVNAVFDDVPPTFTECKACQK